MTAFPTKIDTTDMASTVGISSTANVSGTHSCLTGTFSVPADSQNEEISQLGGKVAAAKKQEETLKKLKQLLVVTRKELADAKAQVWHIENSHAIRDFSRQMLAGVVRAQGRAVYM